LDVADGQIPISCLLTSASLHDSQVAIPLATLTATRVTSLYDSLRANIDETVLLVVITEQGENRNQCEEQWNHSGLPRGFARRGA